MRRPAMNILLLAIYCLWCHIQPAAAGGHLKENEVEKNVVKQKGAKCPGRHGPICSLGVKRSDIGDVAQSTDLGAEGEMPDRQETRGGEGRGDEAGGRNSDEYRGAKDDDLRSDFSDLRQVSEERELPNNGNSRHSPRSAPLESALGRLRSLLRKTALDVDDQEQEKREEQEEEPPRHSSTDTNRRYIMKDNLTMLRRILDDIERRLDSQPVSDSASKKRGYADEAENK